VVYADTPIFPLIWTDTPLDKMRAKFDAQKHSPLYSDLVKTAPIVGVWVRTRQETLTQNLIGALLTHLDLSADSSQHRTIMTMA
jgi:hypothetical protein